MKAFAALFALCFSVVALGQNNATVDGNPNRNVTFTSLNSPQINSTYYVGTTIQAAVTLACATGNRRVSIPSGATPSDTIAAVTGGCSTVGISDERTTPSSNYTWNGSAYVVVSSFTKAFSGTGPNVPTQPASGFTAGDAVIYNADGSLADSGRPPVNGGISGQIVVAQPGSTPSYAPETVHGDCSMDSTANTTCTKVNNHPLGGAGVDVATGPASATTNDLVVYSAADGTQADSGINANNVPTSTHAIQLANGMQGYTQAAGDVTLDLATDAFATAAATAAQAAAVSTAEAYSANGSNISSGTIPAARLPAAAITFGTIDGATIGATTPSTGSFTTVTASSEKTTPAAGGPQAVNNLGTNLLLKKIAANYWFGNSYQGGVGVINYSDSMVGLREKDVPAPVRNKSVPGSYLPQYAVRALALFVPSQLYPTVTTLGAFENDAQNDPCSGCTAQMTHMKESESELLAWLTIPFSNRVMASNCVQTAGSFAANTDLPLSAAYPFASPGTAMQGTSGSGAILTCTTPTTAVATTEVGFAFNVLSGGTGTATIKVDGVSVTDQCSGTTTFTAAPCEPFTSASGQTEGIYRQEVTSGTSATSHVVVFTFTNSATFIPEYADTSVPNAATNNVVFQYNTIGLTSVVPVISTYNTMQAASMAAFVSHGLNTFLIDTVNGIAVNGTTYLVSPTADTSQTATATCSASTLLYHPNTCGHEHYRELHQAAEYYYGWQFSSPGIVNTSAVTDAFQTQGVYSARNALDTQLTAAATLNLNNSTTVVGGLYHITGSTAITTIVAPPECLNINHFCQIVFVADSSLTFSTGGNLATAFTMTAGQAVTMTYEQINSANLATAGKWYSSR